LILFFYGLFISGLAGMKFITLLIVGIILIVIEFVVTGGILGSLVAAAVILSFFMARYDVSLMALSISIVNIVHVLAYIILCKWIVPNRGILKKIILKDRTATELGYTSNDEREELIGQTGITVSMLRPAGIMETETERLDVVSEGSFIEAGVPVIISKV